MSIVTEALNRVQSERARPTHSPEPTVAPKTPSSPASPVSTNSPLLTPNPPSKTIRNILRVSLIIVGVGAVGIGAYLWGLTLVPDVARVSPDHDVIPEVVSESTREEEVLPQVADSPPVQIPTGQSSEVVASTTSDAATGSESTKTESLSDVRQKAKASESVNPQLEHVASLEEARPQDSQNLKTPARPSTPVPQTNKSSENPETVASETPNTLSTEEAPSPPANSKANSPKRSNPSVPRVARNPTPTEAKLIQAKYLIKKQRYEHALAILKPLFVTPPETWEPWFWLGTAHLGLEHFEHAEEAFLEGLSRNAAIPHLWVQRALVSQQRGLYGEAVEALRQAELIAPDLPEVQLNLAYSLEVQGQNGVAVQHYQAFLAMTEGRKSYQAARKKVLERIIQLEAA